MHVLFVGDVLLVHAVGLDALRVVAVRQDAQEALLEVAAKLVQEAVGVIREELRRSRGGGHSE